jgi:hypothetical protein
MSDQLHLPILSIETPVLTKGIHPVLLNDQQIMLHFVHPTESSKILTATVGSSATPHYLVDQMVKGAFLAKPGVGAEYKLVDTMTGKELADHVTLAALGVAPNTTLNILHSVTGAGPRKASR